MAAKESIAEDTRPLDANPLFRRVPVNLRYWPGLEGWRSPEKPGPMLRLKDRMGLYTSSRCPRHGQCLSVLDSVHGCSLGHVILSAGVFYDDQFEARDPDGLRSLRERCEAFTIDTPIGRLRLSCSSLTDFNTGPFLRHAYIGRCAVIGADLGRTLGLMADWWAPSRRPELPRRVVARAQGLGGGQRTRRETPLVGQLRPPMALRPRGRVLRHEGCVRMAEVKPWRKRRGVWVTNAEGNLSSYRGHFLDVIGSAFSFDGEESPDLADHLLAWGIGPVDASSSITVDPAGCERAIAIVRAVHRLAMAVDSEAARWG